jgi:NNP family nitrate/nitrite transporter-like MFS transporter
LLLSALPVMGIGLARDFEMFLVFRVLIGIIGASFVITQYHTSVMFAPNCVGTANATAAGWGNLGGGVTQMVMPLLFALFVSVLGFSEALGWRLAMLATGVICALTGVAYYFLTQDAPEGNYKELRALGKMAPKQQVTGSFLDACRDRRVWALFAIYGACFGIELTMDNIASLYYVDYFDYFQELDTVAALKLSGLFAGLFGLMNVFARAVGGIVADMFGARWGLSGRVKWLFIALFCEGLFLMLFSQMRTLTLAIPAMILFGLFVKMSNGATYAVVPFINRRALGSVAGIVGAGGNAGAVAAGFLFKGSLPWPTALFIIGAAVTAISFLSFAVTFNTEAETEARAATEAALADRRRALEPVAAGASA